MRFHTISLLLLLLLPLSVHAQVAPFEPADISAVTLEIWPDYDRPAALVLVTAALPLDTPTLVQLRLPLPAAATLNAVAYVENGDLVALSTYEREGDELIVTSPTPGVRIEYYLPLTGDEEARAFNLAWTAPVNIGRLAVAVQEPAFSTAFVLDQSIEEVVVTSDGLRTHQLPLRSVRAGETVVVSGRYELPGGRLTVALPSPPPSSVWGNLQTNWPWTAAGFTLLATALFFGWQAWQERRTAARPGKPSRQRTLTCPECSAKNERGSRFCGSCGQELKSAKT